MESVGCGPLSSRARGKGWGEWVRHARGVVVRFLLVSSASMIACQLCHCARLFAQWG